MIGTKHVTEVVDSGNRVVGERSVGLGRRVAMPAGGIGERSVGLGRRVAMPAGGIGNENAGMSMRKCG